MSNISRYILLLIIGLFVAACGSDDSFIIEGNVVDSPTMNIYIKYYNGAHIVSGVTPVDKGKFRFEGRTKAPSLAEIVDKEQNVLARAYLKNGDNISMTIDRNNPYRSVVSGSSINDKWSQFLNANSDTLSMAPSKERNAIIERYMAQNLSDPLSSILFSTEYAMWIDPVQADTLLKSLDHEFIFSDALNGYAVSSAPFVKPESIEAIDTLRFRTSESKELAIFTPAKAASVLVFTNSLSHRADSVVPKLKALSAKKELYIIDFYLESDSSSWKREIRRDSADWVQAWTPGGIFANGIDRLALPKLPYWIVVDSAGAQKYRGTEYHKAAAIADSIIGKK